MKKWQVTKFNAQVPVCVWDGMTEEEARDAARRLNASCSGCEHYEVSRMEEEEQNEI